MLIVKNLSDYFVVVLQVISEFSLLKYRLGNLVIVATVLIIVAIAFYRIVVVIVNTKVNI